MKFIKQFFSANKTELITCTIVLILGAAFLQIKNNGTFNLGEFVTWFPMYYGIFIFMALGMAIFYGGDE